MPRRQHKRTKAPIASAWQSALPQQTASRYAPLLLAMVLIAVVLAYLPAMSGGILWDDSAHLTRFDLQPAGGLYRIWFELGATQQYYPLLHSAFWLEHWLWGDTLLGYHLITLFWHGISVVLIYLILTKLKIPGALLAAAIFALHPVMVESVAWISEQKNTLSTAFYLSSLLIYLSFDESRRGSLYAASLVLFILGLLTKTVVATLPAALLVIFWWQRGKLSWRRDMLPLVPFFILGAAAGSVTAHVERQLIGAHGPDFALTILQRILLAGRAVWFYIGKLICPANLILIYPRWQIDPSVWWQWLFPATAILVTIVLIVLRSRTRAPLAAWLLFVGTLFPALGFVNVYPFLFSFVADHFQYLASISLIALFAATVMRPLPGISAPGQLLSMIVATVLVGVLALLTWQQSQGYADSIKLYETTLARNPSCWMAQNNLGEQLATNGDHRSAIEHYRIALQLRPAYAEAHNNLGYELMQQGNGPEAIAHLQEAAQLAPDFAQAKNNLGLALLNAGRNEEAITVLQSASTKQPRDPVILNNLGIAFSHAGRLNDAISTLSRAVELKPDFADAHNSLGIALARNGQMAPAIEHLRRAVELNPQDANARKNLASALSHSGKNSTQPQRGSTPSPQTDGTK